MNQNNQPKHPRFDSFLFDLDGTLLDTHKDMGNALNVVLDNHGKPPLPLETIRPFVSKGSLEMVCMAFKCEPESAQSTALRQAFLDAYSQALSSHTVFFPGMDSILKAIENSGRKWGIVTNKPGFLTDPLLQDLQLDKRAGCIVSGDTLAERKPHPAPLLHACKQIGSSPSQAIYIGDDERDIQAGRSAGMVTLAAAWGYIIEQDNPNLWHADAVIQQPQDIASWLD